MKGIVEQASNKKYWDIWKQQKLNPELEAKRQNILYANQVIHLSYRKLGFSFSIPYIMNLLYVHCCIQTLTNQIIELERHFNNLEINRFGESGGTSLGHPVFQSGLVPARYGGNKNMAIFSLYDIQVLQVCYFLDEMFI